MIYARPRIKRGNARRILRGSVKTREDEHGYREETNESKEKACVYVRVYKLPGN